MKKTGLKVLSVILVVSMLFAVTVPGASAAQSFGKRLGSAALGGIISGVLSGLNFIFPDGKDFVKKADYVTENFYEGTGLMDSPAENARWKLGYSNTSLVPDDWQTHKYYLGGYIMIENGFNNHVELVLDDMKARVIAIDDGSGRGISLFATIDSIGTTNADIKEIRKLVEEKIGDKYDFASINVSSTHAHSGIDTEGLWSGIFGKVLKNIPLSFLPFGEMETGTDPHFMEFLYEQISDAMVDAVNNMVTGEMTLSRKDIGADYFNNKNRSSSDTLMTDMVRLCFTPDDESLDPTMIINVAAHPDVAGLPTEGVNTGRQLSGEYVYYMGELLAEAGYNCMFFNGAIAGIYMSRGASNDNQDFNYRAEQSARYGYELARMALALNMTEEEIKTGDLKDILYNEEQMAAEMAIAEKNGGGYTVWCEGWTPVEEVKVDPMFNIVLSTVNVPVTNPLIQLAGKLNLANYNVIVAGFKKYEIQVEIGYIEFGNQLKVAMMPGEICQDLIVGGSSMTADGSYSGKDFEYPCLAEMFNDEDIICFGLTNDAIGYVVPDNDYIMAIAFDHYQELISLGKKAASTIMEGFTALAKEAA